MTDPFAKPQTDYDSAENSDVLASGMFDGWELLVVLVPTATLACPTVPEVFPMGLIDRVVVAVEHDYFNARIDEAYPVACREAAAEGWLGGDTVGDQVSHRLAERINQHALSEAVNLGQAFIHTQGPSTGSRKDHQ